MAGVFTEEVNQSRKVRSSRTSFNPKPPYRRFHSSTNLFAGCKHLRTSGCLAALQATC
jgi:hypothetical protein